MAPEKDGIEEIERLISTLFDRASQQCEMMARMLSDPELVNTAPIFSMGLEFTMKAIGIAARDVLQREQAIPGNLERLAISFLDKHDEFLACTLNAHYHKNDKEMGKGWECGECGNAVPQDPVIEGLRRGPLRVFLSCKVCGRRTELTKDGYMSFMNLFGKNVTAPRWNPRANEFKWDGS